MSAQLERAARLDRQRAADLDANDAAMNAHVHPIFQRLLAPFAPPAHQMNRESTGSGMSDTVTPVCSCGWRGKAVEGWRDYQMTDVMAQEKGHLSAYRVKGGAHG